MKKKLGYYIGLLVFFITGVILVILKGNMLNKIDGQVSEVLKNTNIADELSLNFNEPIAKFLFQIIIILIVSRILGWLMIKMGQPTVIGDIIAGILLGPSLLGILFPEFFHILFNNESIGTLNAVSKVGLILFMFIIGLELDITSIKGRMADSFVISHSGIATAFLTGLILAYFIFPEFAPEHISFISFGLFIGIAMSITAFPVLARIMQEHDMLKTPIGSLVLTIAASDDIAAWIILAFVIAAVHTGAFSITVTTIFFAIVFILFMVFALKKVLARFANNYFSTETFNKRVFSSILLLVFTSAYVAEFIGINAMFGAFLAGVVIPSKSEFKELISQKIEDISLVLFLPLFFVITGLRTDLSLITANNYWILTLSIIGLAIFGKSLGLFIASKVTGYSNKDSLTICTLMNTRGLMELIVLNIGYEFGILNKTLFSIFVIMALVTTFMTSPLLKFIKNIYEKRENRIISTAAKKFKVLLSFGPPRSGIRLLQVANALNFNTKTESDITGIHLTPNADITIAEAQKYEEEGFAPVIAEANSIDIKLKTKYKATYDVSREIIQFANDGNFNLMLVGSSKAVFDQEETGGKVKGFLDAINCTVGVLVDKGFGTIDNILIIVDEPEDAEIVNLMSRFLEGQQKKVTLVDNIKILSKNLLSEQFRTSIIKHQVEIVPSNDFENLKLSNFQMILVSREYWLKAKGLNEPWINVSPSVLVIG